MTKNTELERYTELFLVTCRKCLQETGDASPTLVAFTDSGRKAIVDTLPRDKVAWFSFITDILDRLDAESYFIIGAATVVTTNQRVDVETLPIDKNPVRTEQVLVLGFERSGGRIMLSQQFVRDHDRIKFIEPVDVHKLWCSFVPVPEEW